MSCIPPIYHLATIQPEGTNSIGPYYGIQSQMKPGDEALAVPYVKVTCHKSDKKDGEPYYTVDNGKNNNQRFIATI